MDFFPFSSQQKHPILPNVVEVSAEEVYAHRSRLLLIDVRSDREFAEGHISDTQLIPLDRLNDHWSQVPKDQTVVFVCRSGQRSAQASDLALRLGYHSTCSLQGGIIRWKELGYETVTS